MGSVWIVNLRLASEEGANIEDGGGGSEGRGPSLLSRAVPTSSADPKAAEAGLRAITTRGAEPAFIHCAGGNRAATMWLIKRVAVDHWDVERATGEGSAARADGISGGASVRGRLRAGPQAVGWAMRARLLLVLVASAGASTKTTGRDARAAASGTVRGSVLWSRQGSPKRSVESACAVDRHQCRGLNG